MQYLFHKQTTQRKADTMAQPLENITTPELMVWLQNHEACKDAGIRIGTLDLEKANKYRLELTKRGIQDDKFYL